MIKLNNILLEVATGDCYQAAGRLMTKLRGDHTLVHGMVNGQGALEGKRFGHAWVETNDTVLDHSNGKKLEVPKDLYYAIGGVRKEDNKYYNTDESLKWILKAKHWGPWEMSGDTISMYEDIPTDDKEVGKEEVPVDRADMTKLMPMLKEIGDASIKPYDWNEESNNNIMWTPAEFKQQRYGDGSTTAYLGESNFEFKTDKGTEYIVKIEYDSDGAYEQEGLEVGVDFYTKSFGRIDNKMGMTNMHEQYRVMATIVDIVLQWINEWDEYFILHEVNIEPKVEDDETDYGTSSKRGKLYSAYIKKQLPKLNNSYRYRTYEDYFQLYPTDRERQTK